MAVSVQLVQLDDIEFRMRGVAEVLASGVKQAVAIKSSSIDVQAGGIVQKRGQHYFPSWQLTAPRFIGQLSAGNQHFFPRGHMTQAIERIKVHEGDPVTVRGRLVEEDGTLLYLADVDRVTWRLFEVDGSTPDAIRSEVLVSDDVLSASLQVTSGWRRDATGFVFTHTVPGEDLVQGGTTYRVEYIFHLVAGGSRKHAAEILVAPLYTQAHELEN